MVLCGLVLAARDCSAKDRCEDFRTDVRVASEHYFGIGYPWWYSLGQLKQESRCRTSVTAFDGGMGLAQFMPATAAVLSRQVGLPLDPYNPHDATLMQAAFLFQLRKQTLIRPLWPTYQAYNGGWKWLKLEAQRAGSWNRADMRKECRRKVLTLKSGAKLNLCDVNYDYPHRVSRYGDPFRSGADAWPFW
jgi:hypothetical protein